MLCTVRVFIIYASTQESNQSTEYQVKTSVSVSHTQSPLWTIVPNFYVHIGTLQLTKTMNCESLELHVISKRQDMLWKGEWCSACYFLYAYCL